MTIPDRPQAYWAILPNGGVVHRGAADVVKLRRMTELPITEKSSGGSCGCGCGCGLALQLGKQVVAEAELSPSLVEDEAPVAVDLRILPPDAYMLRGEAHLKLAALIAQRQPGPRSRR